MIEPSLLPPVQSDAPPVGGQAFLTGGSEMESRIRDVDWDATSLGSLDIWPQSLRTTVRLMLTTRHPMFIFWGDESLCLYNDAYSLSLGPEKHPVILGMPGNEAWPEIWEIIGPQIELVMRGEGATWHENQLVPIVRHGGLQDVYWTYSYGPIDEPTAPMGVGGVLVVCTETTAQVLSEQRRDAEIQRLRTLFSQAPGFMCVLRGPEHVFELANEAYLLLVGNRDVIGKPVLDALPDIAGQGIKELLDRVYRTGEAYIGRSQRITLERSPGAEPEELFLDFVYEPIRDETGLVVGIFCEGGDVTENMRARVALESSQKRLSTALTIARLGTFEWNVQTGVIDLDSRSREIFGFGVNDEAQTLDLVARIHPEDRDRVLAEANALRDDRARVVIEFRVVQPEGTVRYVRSINDVVVDADNQVVSMLGVFADVTERRQAEAERQTFLDTLTHDLKSPLAALKAQAQMLRRTIVRHGVPDAKSLQDRATIFVDLADRMTALIGEFGDQARLTMGIALEINVQRVDLIAVVTEMIDEVRQADWPHTIRFTHDTDTVIGEWDPVLLRRVVGNLLSNAVKYSPNGDEVSVHLRVDGKDAVVAVQDAGIGIPAQDLPFIFDFRRRGSNVGLIGGSGVGLAGVRRIVEQHGGSIAATSVVQHGSTFTMRLPITSAQ